MVDGKDFFQFTVCILWARIKITLGLVVVCVVVYYENE